MYFPKLLEPMLAVEHTQPFDSEDHLFEIKWDGYRCLAYCDGGVKLLSRNKKDLTARFPEVAAALSRVPFRCILDGELVALTADQRPSFSLLQSKFKGKSGIMGHYAVFDLLYLDDRYLLELPLVERRALLVSSLEGYFPAPIFLSKAVEKQGIRFFQAVAALDLEGMLAKRKDSIYLPGKRSRAWLKIKRRQETCAVIVGYVPEPYGIKSLILAQYDQERLVYVGSVGTGFSQKDKAVLREGLQGIQAPCPLADPPAIPGAVWVKPVLVARVTYLEYTGGSRLRQASFEGLKPDAGKEECTVPWHSSL